MKRLRLCMMLFCVLLALPLAFVAWRTYGALERESRAQVRFFAERLLDDVEAELGEIVRREEGRGVDEYRHMMIRDGGSVPSPLAAIPAAPYILGYLQNNPDGSFETPLVGENGAASGGIAGRVRQLAAVNTIFNRRKRVAGRTPVVEKQREAALPDADKQTTASFAERFLKDERRSKAKSVLGQQATRVEEITVDQALNLARKEAAPAMSPMKRQAVGRAADAADEAAAAAGSSSTAAVSKPAAEALAADGRFQVEVAPLQAVAVDAERIFIFRRIGIGGEIYRQGFVLRLAPFLDHLLSRHFNRQPIADYTRLTLSAAGFDATLTRGADDGGGTGMRVAGRSFPVPFGFLRAEMTAVRLPSSPARQPLTLALVLLGVVMVAGLVLIHQSARAVLDLSERRSQFVSAVTHELKTPLTNIRMYIEMLEQGIAATPEREQDYLGILASESARLSGLINNVLELSRLEKKTRRFDCVDGDLSDVLADARAIMAESLEREGFTLEIDAGTVPVFAYDHEVLVQVLINLMENSIKFGRHLPQKRIRITVASAAGRVDINVSDTGPGIPRRALRHVFDDFYRVEDERVRATGGTGIGLALVKKFILAMGGRVRAQNNAGPGCTITLSLPATRRQAST